MLKNAEKTKWYPDFEKAMRPSSSHSMTDEELKHLLKAHYDNQSQFEHSFWNDLLRKHTDIKLNQLSHRISLELLSPEQLIALMQKTQQEAVSDVKFFNLSRALIQPMQQYIETTLKKAVSKKFLSGTTKRTVTIDVTKNKIVLPDQLNENLQQKFVFPDQRNENLQQKFVFPDQRNENLQQKLQRLMKTIDSNNKEQFINDIDNALLGSFMDIDLLLADPKVISFLSLKQVNEIKEIINKYSSTPAADVKSY